MISPLPDSRTSNTSSSNGSADHSLPFLRTKRGVNSLFGVITSEVSESPHVWGDFSLSSNFQVCDPFFSYIGIIKIIAEKLVGSVEPCILFPKETFSGMEGEISVCS